MRHLIVIFACAISATISVPSSVRAQLVPLNFVQQWELLPQESLFSLVGRGNIQVVGNSMARLDPPMVVNVIYLQTTAQPFYFYRCVEYTREWKFETIDTSCFVAKAPKRIQ